MGTSSGSQLSTNLNQRAFTKSKVWFPQQIMMGLMGEVVEGEKLWLLRGFLSLHYEIAYINLAG